MDTGSTSGNTVGVLIKTVADNGAITQTQAELTVLEDKAKAAGAGAATAKSSFDNFNSSLKKVGDQTAAVGRSMTAGITAPIAAIGYEAVKSAMNFQQAMELLHTNAGVAQGDIAGLSNSVLAMAGQVGQAPEALATAFYHIATAGQGIWNTAQQLDVLKTAAQGAAVGQASLDDTTYSLTSTLAANVKGATDVNATMGTLLGTVQAGDMHLSDLNEVIGTGLLGTLSTFGVSLQSAGAALADFGDLGEKGAAAGTRLRMMLTLMASPSQAAAKILGDLGLDAEQAGTATQSMNAIFAQTGLSTTKLADDLRQPNGIFVAITDLKSHLEAAGLSASETDSVLSKAFGGGKSDAALLQLLNTTDRLDLKFQQIGQDSGNFSDNWAAQQQTAKQQFQDAWGGIQADLIKLGDAIMPSVTHAMNDVGHAIGDISNWFDHLSSGQKQFVIDAAAVAAATGPVLLVFGSLAKSISSILTLSKTVGGALGIVSKIGGVSKAGGLLGSIVGGAGDAAAVDGVAASFTGLAAVLTGPVGLAILGTAAAGFGFYELWQHLGKQSEDFSQQMANQRAGWNQWADSMNFATSAQENLVGASKAHDDAENKLAADTTTLTNLQKQAADATNNYSKAEQQLNKDMATYGSGSPQVQADQQKLNDLAQTSANLLNAVSAQQQQVTKDANALNTATSNLTNAQGALNAQLNNTTGQLSGINDKISTLRSNAAQGIDIKVGTTLTGIKLSGPASQGSTELNLVKALMGGSSGSSFQVTGSSVQMSGTLQGGLGLGFATGTNYAPGGWTTVGENGPENMYVPQGAQIQTNSQSSAPSNSINKSRNTTVSIGTIVLQTSAAVKQFFTSLDQDTINAGKGLTTSRGLY